MENVQNRFAIREILQQASSTGQEYAINLAVLKSMQKAIYSPEPTGHYALNSQHYCHFTSPIRRYPDLVIHRLIDQINRGKTPRTDFVALQALGDHCSERERIAEVAERELIKLKLLGYLSQHLDMTMEAVVTGVEDFGLFVRGLELPAEGLLHVSSLNKDQYKYDPQTHTLSGHRQNNQFRLGDKLLVKVARVDLNRRQLDFHFVRQLASAKPVKKTAKRPSKRRKKSTRPAKKKRSHSKNRSNQGSRKKKGARKKKRRSG